MDANETLNQQVKMGAGLTFAVDRRSGCDRSSPGVHQQLCREIGGYVAKSGRRHRQADVVIKGRAVPDASHPCTLSGGHCHDQTDRGPDYQRPARADL